MSSLKCFNNKFFNQSNLINKYTSYETINNLRLSAKPFSNDNPNSSLTYTNQIDIKCIFKYWLEKFKNDKVSDPTESIQYILASVYKLNKVSDVFKKFKTKVQVKDYDEINYLCEQRLKRVPLQYILKEWQFRDLSLFVEPPVFIPRPETELLIDIILKDVKNDEKNIKNILEIGCGSGAISLALLKELNNIKIVAVDKSSAACNLTIKNCIFNGLQNRINVMQYAVKDDKLLEEVTNHFDLIVSNPPYVPTNDVAEVQPEIKWYEDLDALDGGNDGLTVIKSILLLTKSKLISNGKLYLEVDPSHPEMLAEYLIKNANLGLKLVEVYKDFCGKNRFLKIERIK